MGAVCIKAWTRRHVRRVFCLLFASCPIVGAAQDADPALGASVYTNNCAACHQSNGEGIPGAFPALRASPVVLGDVDSLLTVVLAGRGGMPTFNTSLSDEQVAAVVNYIRNAWGNQVDAVSTAQVQAVSSRIDAVADEGGRGN